MSATKRHAGNDVNFMNVTLYAVEASLTQSPSELLNTAIKLLLKKSLNGQALFKAKNRMDVARKQYNESRKDANVLSHVRAVTFRPASSESELSDLVPNTHFQCNTHF